MTTARRRLTKTQPDSAVTGYESELWRMADALRGSISCTIWRGKDGPVEYADVPGL